PGRDRSIARQPSGRFRRRTTCLRERGGTPRSLDELPGEPLHPAVNGDVINGDAALGQKLFNVPVGQAVPQVPADRHRNHLRREPEAGKDGGRASWSHRTSLPPAAINQRNSAVQPPVAVARDADLADAEDRGGDLNLPGPGRLEPRRAGIPPDELGEAFPYPSSTGLSN